MCASCLADPANSVLTDADFVGDSAIGFVGVRCDRLFRALAGGNVGQAAAASGVGKRSAAFAAKAM
jgi:hypothetical protein